jgi:hypothetical protein
MRNKRFLLILIGFLFILSNISCSKEDLEDLIPNDISVTSLTSDFKVSPNTSLPAGSEFYNVHVASDPNNGFLITWQSQHIIESTIYFTNYACRVSDRGEVLDNAAILTSTSGWRDFVPEGIFEGGNWIISSNKGGLLEWVGIQRLSPTGVVLDKDAIDICKSIGMATLLWPTIASNGNEILCVIGAAGSGLYGSIFNSDLNILLERFLIYENNEGILNLQANGDDFFLTFMDKDDVKLILITNEGQILSVQNVNLEAEEYSTPWRFFPSVCVVNNVSYITYLDTDDRFMDPPVLLCSRRYSMTGIPIDTNPIQLIKLNDYFNFLEPYYFFEGFLDMTCVKDCIYFFTPKSSGSGINMYSFKSDLTEAYIPSSLNSQCQLQVNFGPDGYDHSYSFIRAASIGNKILTAWIDGRDGIARVYANLFEIKEN